MLHIQGVHLTEKRIIIALDFPTAAAAEQFLSGLDPASCRVKIGKELFTAAGQILSGAWSIWDLMSFSISNFMTYRIP